VARTLKPMLPGFFKSVYVFSALMTQGITWCFDDESIADVVERMEQKQIHHIPVLNRDKRMVGIVSLSDLALRGPQELFSKVSTLTSRDALRHASQPPH
jgi:CBS domain-containing protein